VLFRSFQSSKHFEQSGTESIKQGPPEGADDGRNSGLAGALV
jgi:hypothetical protein